MTTMRPCTTCTRGWLAVDVEHRRCGQCRIEASRQRVAAVARDARNAGMSAPSPSRGSFIDGASTPG